MKYALWFVFSFSFFFSCRRSLKIHSQRMPPPPRLSLMATAAWVVFFGWETERSWARSSPVCDGLTATSALLPPAPPLRHVPAAPLPWPSRWTRDVSRWFDLLMRLRLFYAWNCPLPDTNSSADCSRVHDILCAFLIRGFHSSGVWNDIMRILKLWCGMALITLSTW